MRLDRLIQVLLPHDEKFYGFFEESAQNLVNAAQLLPELFRAQGLDRELFMNKIHDFEHLGDTVTHKVYAELNSTFVTPFDREDIHLLAAALDDVMDFIDGSASRFVLYKVRECPPEVMRMIETLQRQVSELQKGVSLLRDFRQSEALHRILEKINEYENEADAIFEHAIANLFELEKDPVQIIKLKEIYVGLETATDMCEDAANVLETLLIKHG
jgi:predicted phosphate transport protein (TIGR00153 family)